MNLFKQVFLGMMFVSSLYCSIIFLWLGECLAAGLLAAIALGVFLVGRKLIAELIRKDYEIRNKSDK